MVNVICCCCWFWSVFDFSLWPFIFRIRIQCQTEKGWQKFNLGTSNLNGLGQSSREKTKIWKIRMLSQDMGLQQFHDLFTFPPWWSDKRGNLKISLLFVKVLFKTNPTKPQPSKSVAPFKRYYRKKFLLRRPSEYLYYLITTSWSRCWRIFFPQLLVSYMARGHPWKSNKGVPFNRCVLNVEMSSGKVLISSLFSYTIIDSI